MQGKQRQTQRRRDSSVTPVAHTASFVEPLEPRTLMAATPVLLRDPALAGGSAQVGDKTFITDWTYGLNVTNGTAGGTLQVKAFGHAGAISAIGNEVYFATDTGIWRSDGTTTGTVQVAASSNPDGVADVRTFLPMGGAVYFILGGQLIRTDGTPGGTSSLKSLYRASNLTVAANRLFFIGNDEVSGDELWTSDGTPGGTVLVKDLLPGSSGSMFAMTDDRPIAALGSRVIFVATGSDNRQIYASDGTPGGTTLLSNSAHANGELTNFNGAVYFSAYDANQNQQLWKTDGTPGGTVLVKGLGTTGFGSRAGQLTVSGNRLYFAASNGFNGVNLWKSDGTGTGTVVVKGAATGTAFAGVFNLTDIAGTLAFTAADAAVQSGAYSLWTSDGSTAGTVKIRDTFTGSMQGVYGTIGARGTIALFTANDGVGAPELYALQTSTTLPVPEAHANVPAGFSVPEGGTISLHGYTSAEPLPGRPLTYAWDLDGDGLFGETGAAATRGTETGTDPAFRAAGLDGPSTFTVRFRISDFTGYNNVATADVAITNVAPTLNVTGGPAVLVQGNPYTLRLSSTDPGLDGITNWAVNWGDGITQSFPGSTTSATHTYPLKPAEYGIYVTATDKDGTYRFSPPAALDTSFGSGGIVYSQFGTLENQPNNLVVQPDGKILALSSIRNTAQFDSYTILVTRYNPDGTLDSTFGNSGRVIFDTTGYAEIPSSMMLQPDGRIVVAGYVRSSLFPFDIGAAGLLLRLLPDGSLDPSFGGRSVGGADGGPGWVTYQFGFNEVFTKLELNTGGKIVASGTADDKPLIVRFNANGSIDATSGVTSPGTGSETSLVQTLPDGRYLIGSTSFNPDPVILVSRYNPDGTPDTSFGPGGQFTLSLGGRGYSASLRQLLLQSDGAPLLYSGAGDAHYPTEALVRLTPTSLPVRVTDAAGPVATVDAPPAIEGSLYTLGLHASDPDNDGITEWIVNWGDGSVDVLPGNPKSVTHVYADGPRTMEIHASVIDGDHSITRVTASVAVANVAPTITVTGDDSAPEGSPYLLSFSAVDPGADTRTSWTVDWGDGTNQTLPASYDSQAHAYQEDGTYTVTVSTTDEDGTYSANPFKVLITNVAPTLDPLVDRVAAAKSAFVLAFTANDVVREQFGGSIDWGDGSAITPFSNPAGTVTLSQQFLVQHTYAARGDYTVTVNLNDGDGGTTSGTATVHVGDVVVRVFEDVNGDGVRNAGEMPRVGDIAFLDFDRDGEYDPGVEPVGTTDQAGDVLFNGLPDAAPRSARLAILPDDHHLSTAAAVEVTPGTTTAVATFGLTQVAAVSGVLFDDSNANGIIDRGEGTPPSQLLTVRARNLINGAIVSVQASATGGAYRIPGLPPGQYMIEMTDTSRVITAPRGRRGYLITVTGAEAEFGGLDIGTYGGTGATISGTLFRDYDRNGKRDATEPGLANQIIYIDADDDGVLDPDEFSTVTTSGNGDWSFPRMPGGTYRIRQGWPTPILNDPAAAPLVTVATGQVLSGVNIARYATVLKRTFLYNNSAFDGNDPAANELDDAAVAGDKSALLPGGRARAANISSYDKGINGVIIYIDGLPPGTGPVVGDFDVAVSTDGVTWSTGPAPSVSIRRTASGNLNGDRVTLIWPDNSIKNKWMRLTVKPTAATGLTVADVSYFGNAVGDTANGLAADTAVNVDSADYYGVRDHLRSYDKPNDVTWNWDINRDRVTDITDIILVRSSATTAATALKLITAPLPPATVQSTTTSTSGSSTGKTTGQTTTSTKTTTTTPTTTTVPTLPPSTTARPPVKLLSQRSRIGSRPLFTWGQK